MLVKALHREGCDQCRKHILPQRPGSQMGECNEFAALLGDSIDSSALGWRGPSQWLFRHSLMTCTRSRSDPNHQKLLVLLRANRWNKRMHTLQLFAATTTLARAHVNTEC